MTWWLGVLFKTEEITISGDYSLPSSFQGLDVSFLTSPITTFHYKGQMNVLAQGAYFFVPRVKCKHPLPLWQERLQSREE